MKELTGPHVPRRLFSPIAHNYERPALTLSLFQYRRWRRFMLSRLDPDGLTRRDRQTRVLDVATGTGALAFDLLERMEGLRVVGADITRAMLREAQARAGRDGTGRRLELVECDAEAAPFRDESFDALLFAYLLRYVSDVPGTLRALVRLLKPAGTMVSLDFAVPSGLAYPLWRLYTGLLLPVGGRLYSKAWQEASGFLGRSIRGFYERWPEERLLEEWARSGLVDVQARRLSLGGAIVIWGRRA
ncbi:MAG: class I SAM-dependent methyltransferase [Dehalococcoidia bacterium]|nr:class I SAM-dependent methyltransferase [Dehalococcoidia bacterium]